MSEQERISPFIRVVSGVLGVLGFVAVAFNAVQDGGLRLNFMLVASFFAGIIFLYVSFFGKYPWDSKGADITEMNVFDDPTQVLHALWVLKFMEWLPIELFHVVLTRNGITVPSGGLEPFDRPTGSGALNWMAIQLRHSGVITDAEYEVIVTPSIEEKQEKMRRHELR